MLLDRDDHNGHKCNTIRPCSKTPSLEGVEEEGRRVKMKIVRSFGGWRRGSSR